MVENTLYVSIGMLDCACVDWVKFSALLLLVSPINSFVNMTKNVTLKIQLKFYDTSDRIMVHAVLG